MPDRYNWQVRMERFLSNTPAEEWDYYHIIILSITKVILTVRPKLSSKIEMAQLGQLPFSVALRVRILGGIKDFTSTGDQYTTHFKGDDMKLCFYLETCVLLMTLQCLLTRRKWKPWFVLKPQLLYLVKNEIYSQSRVE